MPTDLLPAAFALTLIVNAALVALSRRAMHGGAAGRPEHAGTHLGAARDARDSRPPRADPPVRQRAAAMTAEAARAVRARREILGEPAPVLPDMPRGAPTPTPAEAPARARSAKARTRPGTDWTPPPAAEPASGSRSATAPRHGRRKFSLPPLDDDHEKVSRSIESFLAGGEPAGPPGEPVGPTGKPIATAPGTSTTVALVELAEAGSRAATFGHSPPAADRRTAEANARAMVERTLRAAARASDTVSSDETGRFRVVLAGTGELAARAYLRRVRTTVEPLLEASAVDLRFVTATATVLEEPLDTAVETARHCLVSALARLDAVRTPEDDSDLEEPEPRAAGD